MAKNGGLRQNPAKLSFVAVAKRARSGKNRAPRKMRVGGTPRAYGIGAHRGNTTGLENHAPRASARDQR